MDSLKTLMDKRQYDLVIKLTENSQDSLSLFYRLTAFVAVGQNEQALNLIETKKDLLKDRLSLLIKFHIEILSLLGRFDEAYEALKAYEEMPYESQEVEEVLRAMPEYIRNAEKESYKRHHVDEEEIYKRLLSNQEDDVLFALDQIKDLKIDNYLLAILKIIKSFPKQVVRTYALLLLVANKYDKEIDFLYFDKLMKVNPSKLNQPFIVDGFKDISDLSYNFQSVYHDPSIAQNALHLISSYLLYIYPKTLDLNKEETIVVFGYLAKRLLQIDDSDLKEVCLAKKLDYEKVTSVMNEINEALNNF
jgi:hypothetical protein